MILTPRSRFGPYDIVELMGAGAMGEVYRAHDSKLGRDVALKVMRTATTSAADRLASFEREARLLASLNHPHIATIYGFHEIDGISALALELVEGETLAARLRKGRLSEAEALRYAVQIADALAYAHSRGVVHRDVKPGNIVITPRGAKLLDFGVAHLVQAATTDSGAGETDLELGPAGTPFYMSPEQNAGLDIDHRSDIYSFGLVLSQMLIGFTPDAVSGISTRTLIRGLLNQIGPRPLRLIVERCLASDPDERWQHASDLRHALAAVSEPDIGDARDLDDAGTTTMLLFPPPAAAPPRTRMRRVLIPIAIAAVAAAAAFLVGQRTADLQPPDYRQLTFRRGSVLSARFAGGNTIVYSAAWDGKAPELWAVRPENPESRSLGTSNATVLAVSPSGEMAILIGRTNTITGGMLAQQPLNANAPREVLSGVDDADWTPDGQSLAVSHVVDGKSRLELPIGTVLYEREGWFDGVRVSPDGAYVAFIDHPLFNDDRGSVSLIARAGGAPRVLSGPWSSVNGLAWSPDGSEVWFTAAEFGTTTSLYAASLSGHVRVLSRSAYRIAIHDVDPDGRVLMTEARYRLRISAMDSTSPAERELSWLDGSALADLSDAGETLLINEIGAGAGTPLYAVYLRKSDGSPAVRIGEGASPALSPDGRSVATLLRRSPSSVMLLPTGAGLPRTLERGSLVNHQAVTWFPDGRRILIAGNEANAPVRLWIQDISSGPPKPVGPPGLRVLPFSRPVSPDGTRAIAMDLERRVWLQPLNVDSARQAVEGLGSADVPIRWNADGQSFYVYGQSELPSALYRFHVSDGRKEQVAVLTPADAAGVRALTSVQTTADGRLFVYSYAQVLSDLFLLTNVRQR
jgi:Tol biopolymer transport system component